MDSDFSDSKRVIDKIKSIDYSQWLRILYYSSIGIGFVIRLVVSMNAWGMKHPDEIYQSLEMAHYLVYGSGFIPPEFQSSNPDIASYAAARSWLFPLFFSIFMRFGELFGLDYHTQTLPLIKFYMAVHATLLIPAVYKLTHQITKDQLASTLSAFLVAFWFRVIEYTVRTFTNTFFLPLVFYGIYKVLYHLENDSFDIKSYLEVGFLLGLSTYIRVDLGIIIFAFFVIYFNLKHLVEYLMIGVSGLLFWIWGAWIDYNIYDGARYFSVIINWFTFNVLKGYSKNFGVSSPLDYLTAVIYQDLLVLWLVMLVGWSIYHVSSSTKYSIFKSKLGSNLFELLKINLVTWFIFSYPISIFDGFSINYSHKEIRFIIGAIVTFLIFLAIFLRMMITELSRMYAGVYQQEHDSFKMKSFQIKQVRQYFIVLFLILFLVTSFTANSYRNDGDDFEGFNKSLAYIGQENPDVDKIIIMEVWYVTGYYSYSHVSQNTTFLFYHLNEPVSRQRTANIKVEIYSDTPDRYFIIPWYAYQRFEDETGDSLESLLTQFDWKMVYEYGGVYTWKIMVD